jgi:hypothetical protein
MDKMQLWPEDIVETDGSVVASVTIERPGREHMRLWYRLPVEHRAILTTGQDPFVLGTIFTAMRASSDLVVHGEVSPSLLRNLEEFQAAWACWRPEWYTKIEITADVEHEQLRADNPDGAIVAFSGGADACFTAWRHRTGRCGRLKRNLQAGVMVQGFDIPLDQPDVFDRAAEKAAKMLTSLGMDLIPVATNLKELREDWRYVHGAGVSSTLILLQGGYVAGLIGSSRPYQAIEPLGSNPVTDWMLSSDSFQIVHDGAAFIRREKLRELANWPEAMENLRVCWAGKHKDRNCGRCQKCIQTILSFRSMELDLPACFEEDVTDNQILQLKELRPSEIYYLNDILSTAKAASISESWVGALEKCLQDNQLRPSGKLSFWHRLGKTIPLTIRKQIRHLVRRVAAAS